MFSIINGGAFETNRLRTYACEVGMLSEAMDVAIAPRHEAMMQRAWVFVLAVAIDALFRSETDTDFFSFQQTGIF